jgi:hypothetical protein
MVVADALPSSKVIISVRYFNIFSKPALTYFKSSVAPLKE